MSSIRKALNGLYLGCGAVAACFLIIIAVLVTISILSRMGGVYVPGLNEYAGYAMAASSFFALAHTFGHGGHIRVNLIIGRLKGLRRRAGEIWCLAIAAFLTSYLAYFLVTMTIVSYEFGDVSEGTDVTPLWIPQAALAIGSTVFAIAVIDRLVVVLGGGPVEITGGDKKLMVD
jgi:TRAP-type C4-dicarboxylate transport system permease small subunit